MFSNAFVSAWESIKGSWARSLLSALGIFVGTLAVMLLISIAMGVRDDVEDEVRSLGVNLIVIVPGRVDPNNLGGGSGNIGLSPFARTDAEAVAKVEGVVRLAKWTFIAGSVTAGKGPVRAFTLGVDPTWFLMRKHTFAEGGPFTGGRQVVIGPEAKKSLFGDAPALHKEVEVNGIPYQVVGAALEASSEGVFGLNLFGSAVYLPFETVAKRRQVQIDRIWTQTDPAVPPKRIVDRIKASMLKTQGAETFSVLTQEDLLAAIYKVLNILTYLVLGISAIALVVGGVGIMTVMLMNVNERKREIGIRKTVGARRGDVFAQFLIEAVMLTLAGGLAAAAGSYAVIQVLDQTTPIHARLTPGVLALGLGVSVGIGCIFGLIPALRAGAKDPVESMRQE